MPVGMKDLPYDQPGVGALNWGVTVDNAPSWISKTRDALAKGITTGGNETNYERIQKWADTPQHGAQSLSPTERAQWNQFLKGGEYPKGLDPQIALHAVDWTLRDKARFDQHKTSFLQDVLSSPITGIAIGALTGGLGAFGSTALAAAAGEAVGSIAGATAMGALTGAATSAAISAGGSLLLDAVTPPKPALPTDVVGAANATLSAKPTKSGGAGAGIGGGPSGGGTLLGGTAQRPIDGMGFGGETRITRTKGAGRAANAPTLLGS